MGKSVSTENKFNSSSLPKILEHIPDTAYWRNSCNPCDLYHKWDLGEPIVLKKGKLSFDESSEEGLKVLVQKFASELNIKDPGFTYTIDGSGVVIKLYNAVRH